ncbi:hypothetical protein PMO31116_04494 [Pandoraea morbifera]|uniref:Type III secretion protein n=1 Tax=Pandoraea morbifera TaxID=2508300 RepID=A0A5E4YJA1_9BURK|nr:hypothetical protein [Pandoraea morbifera]VVE48368.1 hypothetical protein PMO31116_04494 [Pandoraea morbifera]
MAAYSAPSPQLHWNAVPRSTPPPLPTHRACAPQANSRFHDFPAAFSHACALRDAHDLSGAADAFGSLCLQYPERLETFKALGYVLHALGDHDRATSPLLFAFLCDGTDPTPLYFCALSKQRIGDLRAAREMASGALDVARCSPWHARVQASAQRLLDTLSSS